MSQPLKCTYRVKKQAEFKKMEIENNKVKTLPYCPQPNMPQIIKCICKVKKGQFVWKLNKEKQNEY